MRKTNLTILHAMSSSEGTLSRRKSTRTELARAMLKISKFSVTHSDSECRSNELEGVLLGLEFNAVRNRF